MLIQQIVLSIQYFHIKYIKLKFVNCLNDKQPNKLKCHNFLPLPSWTTHQFANYTIRRYLKLKTHVTNSENSVSENHTMVRYPIPIQFLNSYHSHYTTIVAWSKQNRKKIATENNRVSFSTHVNSTGGTEPYWVYVARN